ncbi:MAG: ABC-2 type transporter [Candidatus Izimaplasma bacterium HR2]|nr:MAG: ABC-2 type transporter [Candidatus Izimaplasma bacterium HR2]
MNILYQLVLRNTKIFLRDKATVFFSFLSVIIIIIMYVLFLGKMQTDTLSEAYNNVDGIDWLVSSWIMAGILTVSTVTVPLSAIGTLINDRTTGVLNDFYTSPINRNLLALSYLMSSWVIAFIMVGLNFIVGQTYVVIMGGEILGFISTIKILGLVLLSIMTFSSLFFYIALFMKTSNAFSTLATLIGTFIGFLGGIYIPIGVLGKNVQIVMNLLPSAHSVTLMRNIYMEGAIDKVFANAPIEAFEDYSFMFGLEVNIGDHLMSHFSLVISMIAFGLFFYVLSVIKLSKSKL